MSHKLSILIWAAPTSMLNIVVVEMKLSIRPLTTTTTMAARHGKEGAHYTCPPPGKCKGQIPFNYNVLIRINKNQNRCHQTRFTGSK